MNRTPLADRRLPNYSKRDERANTITHIVGGAAGILILLLAVLISILHKNIWGLVSGSIYGVCMVLLYTVSSVYHGLKPGYAKKVMQVIDHCTIYLLIAGSYTPILLTAIRPLYPKTAWLIFAAEWALAAFGAVFTAIDHYRYRKLAMFCYIGMGWFIIFALKPTYFALGKEGVPAGGGY